MESRFLISRDRLFKLNNSQISSFKKKTKNHPQAFTRSGFLLDNTLKDAIRTKLR